MKLQNGFTKINSNNFVNISTRKLWTSNSLNWTKSRNLIERTWYSRMLRNKVVFLKHLVDDCMCKFQVCYLDRLKVFESIIKSMIHSKKLKISPGVWLSPARRPAKFCAMNREFYYAFINSQSNQISQLNFIDAIMNQVSQNHHFVLQR